MKGKINIWACGKDGKWRKTRNGAIITNEKEQNDKKVIEKARSKEEGN